MELVSLHWLRPGDIHLMRGRSPALDLADALHVEFKANATSPVEFADGATFLHDHPAAQFTFKPIFKANLNAGTQVYTGMGVTLNARTGRLTTGPNPAPRPLFNFSVLASLVADKNDPASPRKKAYLRIHLHNHVAKAWLSPSRLRVPKNIENFSFSVYAQFDDKTIADLSRATGITWSSNPAGKVNSGSGHMSFATADADDSEVTITARLPAEFRDQNGTRVDAVGIAVPYTLPRIAELIPGSAGYAQRNEVPNFIFLADGFQDADKVKFDSMIDFFLKDLRQKGMFQPFNHLIGRMNFWKVFVRSAARGITTKFEVFRDGRAFEVPVAGGAFEIENDSPASESDLNDDGWEWDQVRFYFGLPVMEHIGMSDDEIKAYWKQISYLPAALIDKVQDVVVNEWRMLGDRRMVDESDTFVGMYFGKPTSLKLRQGEESNTFIGLGDRRFTRTTLNNFLINLQHKDENNVLHPLGSVWDITPASPASEPKGKDYDNVIILLCSNSGFRTPNEFGFFSTNVVPRSVGFIGIEADGSVNGGFPDGRAVKLADLDADRLPDDMSIGRGMTTLLHEMGHSLGLGDEYGEGDRSSAFFQFTGTGKIENDKHYSNVQVRSDLVVSPSVDRIDPAKVKWRWHRIEKSGVLAALAPPAPAAITQTGAQYTIKLKPGQAAVFKEDEIVILRRRRLSESILYDIGYSQVSAPRYPFVTMSPRLRVRHVDAVASQVVVEAWDPASLTGHLLAADFPAECVLYKPLPARYEWPPAGEFLELTAANILELMTGPPSRPLHEKVDEHGQPDVDLDIEQFPDLGNLVVPIPTKQSMNIVGLYAGGNQYHHGVYHPTGHCIMRQSHDIKEFCSVCKYILTDYIDPALHPEVDKLIEEYYPLKAH